VASSPLTTVVHGGLELGGRRLSVAELQRERFELLPRVEVVIARDDGPNISARKTRRQAVEPRRLRRPLSQDLLVIAQQLYFSNSASLSFMASPQMS
jgi:hypothetical protein